MNGVEDVGCLGRHCCSWKGTGRIASCQGTASSLVGLEGNVSGEFKMGS